MTIETRPIGNGQFRTVVREKRGTVEFFASFDHEGQEPPALELGRKWKMVEDKFEEMEHK